MAHTNTFGDNATPFGWHGGGPTVPTPDFGHVPGYCNFFLRFGLKLQTGRDGIAVSLWLLAGKQCEEAPVEKRGDIFMDIQRGVTAIEHSTAPVPTPPGTILPAGFKGIPDLCKNFDEVKNGSFDLSKLPKVLKDMANASNELIPGGGIPTPGVSAVAGSDPPQGLYSLKDLISEICDKLTTKAEVTMILDCQETLGGCDLANDECTKEIEIMLTNTGRAPNAPPISFDDLFHQKEANLDPCDLAKLLGCWSAFPSHPNYPDPNLTIPWPPAHWGPGNTITQDMVDNALGDIVDDQTKQCEK